MQTPTKLSRPRPRVASMGIAVGLAGVTLLLAGCAPAAPESRTVEQASPAEIEQLRAEGVLPAGFPADANRVWVQIEGEAVGAAWLGSPLTDGCVAANAVPGAIVSARLLQDVGLVAVERCGEVWQATQVDGSHVLWNEAGALDPEER